MSRPLSILYDIQNNFSGLQEMNDVRLEYPVYQICAEIASKNSSGGNLTIGLNDGESTIGIYKDTYYNDGIGTVDANTTVYEQTYILTQKLDSTTTNTPRPVEYSTIADASGATTTGIRPMSDDSIETEFFDRVVLQLASKALGSYVMQADSPASPGETWVAVHTLSDTSQVAYSTTKIWRKTGDTAPSVYRPLLIISNNGDLREMSDTEMKSLFGSYANYVIDSGRGQYRLQETNPAQPGETWYKMGSSIQDTRVSAEIRYYTGTFNRDYTGMYNRDFTATFTGDRIASFLSEYLRNYRATFGSRQGAYYGGWVVREDLSRMNIEFLGFREETFQGLRPRTRQGPVDKNRPAWTITGTINNISKAFLWIRTK